MTAQPSRLTVAIVKTRTPTSLRDGHPVGGLGEVDVLAALRLGPVAAQGGDHEQHGRARAATAPMT